MTFVTLKHSAWFGDKDFKIDFPQEWDVVVHSPKRMGELAKEAISVKIKIFVEGLEPKKIGRKTKLALIVDDISRPTPVSYTITALLSELKRAGLQKENIFIFTAGGTHSKMNEVELKKKLGDEVIHNYKIVTHDMKRPLDYYGKTGRGTPVFINSLLKECELKIGIGGVYPHSPAGFGGGAKIILGVSGFKTIARLHYNFKGTRLGGELENDFRSELEEMAKIVKFDATINIVINDKRQVADIFAGNLIDSHKEAVNFVRGVYMAPEPHEADIVIANTYPFDTTFLFSKKGWWPIAVSAKNSTNIVIGALPLGIGNHGIHPITRNYFSYIFKKSFLMSQLSMGKIFQIILMKLSAFVLKKKNTDDSKNNTIYFRPEELIPIETNMGMEFQGSWERIQTQLLKQYENSRPKVRVYPCSSLQYPRT